MVSGHAGIVFTASAEVVPFLRMTSTIGTFKLAGTVSLFSLAHSTPLE